MLYSREIVHSPERFEQWHLTHTILRSQSFEMLQIRQGGYGVHDIDFWVERPAGKGFSVAVLGILPIAIAYPFFQKYFVAGIAIGGVKE